MTHIGFKVRIILLFIFVLCLSGLLPNLSANQNKICFNNSCFTVEIAQKEEELMRGLQSRESLKEDGGMLFIFPKNGVYGFWMKDTLLALDMIWLDEHKRVIYIAANVPPCQKDPCPTYGPFEETRYVLEINAGLAKKSNISITDQAQFDFEQ